MTCLFFYYASKHFSFFSFFFHKGNKVANGLLHDPSRLYNLKKNTQSDIFTKPPKYVLMAICEILAWVKNACLNFRSATLDSTFDSGQDKKWVPCGESQWMKYTRRKTRLEIKWHDFCPLNFNTLSFLCLEGPPWFLQVLSFYTISPFSQPSLLNLQHYNSFIIKAYA